MLDSGLHTRGAVRFASALAVCLLGLGCRSGSVVGLSAGWLVAPEAVDVGPAYLGGSARATLTVTNTSRAPLTLAVAVEAPFEAKALVAVGGGDTAGLELVFRPQRAGGASGLLRVSDGEREVQVPLAGAGVEIPVCGAPGECRELEFDPVQGRCVERPAPDGAACAGQCLVAATCLQGECVGAPLSCDDGNDCTADSCDPRTGCVHLDVSASCPAPASACQVAVCRPRGGCGVDLAPDGTACGPNDCSTAQVCMAGRCEARAAPEGSQCAGPGVCQAPSTCRQNACVPGAITTLPERWRYSSPGHRMFFEGTVDEQGTVYFTEASSSDPAAALELVALSRDGRELLRAELERPCRGCAARLFLDPRNQLVIAGRAGRVQARDSRTGALLWTRDTTAGRTLRSPRPDGGAVFSSTAFVALGDELVVAELSEGYELHREYSVALERRTGRVAWDLGWWGHVYNPGATRNNELWITQADCWAPIQQSQVLDATGATVGTVVRQARPVVFGDDRALLAGADYVWASRQGVGAPLPVGPAGYAWALTTPGRTVILSYQRAEQLNDDGGTAWARGLPGYIAGAALLADGGTLVSAYAGDGGSILSAVDAQGATSFTCPLPGASSAGTPGLGLYFAVVSRGGEEAIVAFELPGAELEPRGWTTPAGSPRNDRRAH